MSDLIHLATASNMYYRSRIVALAKICLQLFLEYSKSYQG